MRIKISLLFVFAVLLQMNAFGQQKIKDFIEEWEDYGFYDYDQWMNCKSHLEYDEMDFEDAKEYLGYHTESSTYYVNGVFKMYAENIKTPVYGFIITEVKESGSIDVWFHSYYYYKRKKNNFIPRDGARVGDYYANYASSEDCNNLYKIELEGDYLKISNFNINGEKEEFRINRHEGNRIYD